VVVVVCGLSGRGDGRSVISKAVGWCVCGLVQTPQNSDGIQSGCPGASVLPPTSNFLEARSHAGLSSNILDVSFNVVHEQWVCPLPKQG